MVKEELYGKVEGRKIYKYTITDAIEVSVVSLGATVTSIKVPDLNGKLTDIALGFDEKDNIFVAPDYIGATIGRTANRISGGKFVLNGNSYSLNVNERGINNHHGGEKGFNTKVFDSLIKENGVVFSLRSKDGDEGYPGNLDFSVTFTVNGTELIIDYSAISDKDTICAPTSHIYFNLSGHDFGSILDNYVKINSDSFLPINRDFIPTGIIKNVKNTPFDFSSFKKIGTDIDSKDEQLLIAGGYDHNYCLKGEYAASVYSEKTGIRMDVYTDMPGLQFYSGNFLGGARGKAVYGPRSGFAMETQFYPNSINSSVFKKPVLLKGKSFRSRTRFTFSLI